MQTIMITVSHRSAGACGRHAEVPAPVLCSLKGYFVEVGMEERIRYACP